MRKKAESSVSATHQHAISGLESDVESYRQRIKAILQERNAIASTLEETAAAAR